MKTRVFRWVLSLGLMAAASPAGGKGAVCCEISFAATGTPSSAAEDGALRPIKKRVGRAVTPTIDKIDNPWFVISQILFPLCVLLFSLMYVRRYRAKRIAESDAPSPNCKEASENEDRARSDQVSKDTDS